MTHLHKSFETGVSMQERSCVVALQVADTDGPSDPEISTLTSMTGQKASNKIIYFTPNFIIPRVTKKISLKSVHILIFSHVK